MFLSAMLWAPLFSEDLEEAMKQYAAVGMIAVACLGVVGCSGDSGSSSSSNDAAPATITQTITTTDSHAEDTATSTSASEDTETHAFSTRHSINTGQVGGECGTTEFGDRIKAGPATSCEFAAEIFDVAYAATWHYVAANPNVNAVPRADISVTSPVTGETYPMVCKMGSDGRDMWCDHPEDESNSVHFYTSGGSQRMANRVNLVQ